MQTKNQFLKYIENVKDILQSEIITSVGITDRGLFTDDKEPSLFTRIQQAELIVPVVGGFSAGKSTLINSFLENSILPTSITPETALATELRYSENEHIEAINANGEAQKFELSQLTEIKDNAQNFQYLRIYLKNENLKSIDPLVLVDMPGFESPLDSHNKAILMYLSRGVYFVFLTSVEDGTITRSMNREIDIMYDIGKGYSFCLSKTNLRKPDDVQKIKELISQHLKNNFGYHKDIVLFDRNSGKNLENILQSINPEELFKSLFIEQLGINSEQIQNSFDVTVSTLKKSEREVKEAINELNNSLEQIKKKQRQILQDIKYRYADKGASEIISRVRNQLHLQKDFLVSLAVSNKEAFGRELNEIVKRSLISEVQIQFREMSEDIVQEFSDSIRVNIQELGEFNMGTDFVDQIGNKIITEIFSNPNTITPILNTLASMTGVIGTVFKFLNPILGVVLTFLPTIISAFSSKDKQENNVKEQINIKLSNEVIPQIESQLNSTLPPMINKNVEQLVNSISEQFTEELNQKTAEIEKASEEKQKNIEETEAKIAELQTAKQQIITLFNQL